MRLFRVQLLACIGPPLALCLALGGCQKSNSTTAAQNGEQATAQSAESGGESDERSSRSGSASENSDQEGSGASAESAPPADLYPDMKFGKLAPDDRRTFVSIAQSELCPCEKSSESLHVCLQSKKTQCAIAKRMSMIAVSGIQSGLNETDIRDKMAKFSEQANKQYEFNLEGTPRKGPKDADVVIVEFADFQCPHCKAAANLMKSLKSKFGNDMVHYFKHFPLSAHGQAKLAARAAVAAGKQDKFWPMHDLLFKHQRSLSREKIVGFARQIGLNFQKFKKDLASKEVARAVAEDRKEGNRVGIKGTPAIFINGRRYMGEQTEKALSEAVRSALEESTSETE